MKLEARTQIDAVEWDGLVQGLGGTVFHSHAWATYRNKGQANLTPQYLTLLLDTGDAVGVALAFSEKSCNPLVARVSATMHLDSMPLVENGDEKIMEQFFSLIERHALDCGSTALSVGSFASGETDILSRLNYDTVNRVEFVLDLRQSEEDLWRSMEHKRRKNINKAARMGVTIHEMSNKEGISRLLRLQAESGQRIAARGGPDLTQKEDHDPALECLIESGVARLMVARIEDEFISAGLFTCYNGSVYHMLSGHNQRALETQSATLLLWEIIRYYKEKGASVFNQSGCKAEAAEEQSPEHGVFCYKKAFGGTIFRCTSGQKILRPNMRAIYGLLKSLRA